MTLPILYSFRRCPYAMRARLAIVSSGQKVTLREVILRDKPEAMLSISPKGTVPVLLLPDGKVIEESFDIMRWALSQSDPDGLTRENFAQAQDMVAQCDIEFKPHLDAYKYPNKFETPREVAIKNACEYLEMLNENLADQPFLAGQNRGFADIGIAPFVRQFAHVDRDWFLDQSWEHLKKWYFEFTQWDGFLRIMTKYPQWSPNEPSVVFPPEAS